MIDVNQTISNILNIVDDNKGNKVMIHLLVANELHKLVYEAKLEGAEEFKKEVLNGK